MLTKTAPEFKIQNYYSLISEKTKDFVGRSEWLFPQIRDWLADSNGSRYFLITGKAGTGKSAIAARLWEISEGKINDDDLKKGFLSAIHVCSARDYRSSLHDVFSKSLVKQILIKEPKFFQEILDDSNDDKKEINIQVNQRENQAERIIGIYIDKFNINVNRPKELFNKLFLEPVESFLNKNPDKKIVVLIDALDESFCVSNTSDAIISLIVTLYTLSKNIRFILTTRDNEEIIEQFSNDSRILSLSEKYYENNKKDIREYIKLRISKNKILQNHYDGFIDDLTAKAEGNFLYVTFLLDAIVEGKIELTKENLDKVPPF